MPYSNVSELPEHVKKYSDKLQRMFMSVFNSTWTKLTKEVIKKEEKEKRCFQAAQAVIAKNMKKFGPNRYGHESNILVSENIFLNK